MLTPTLALTLTQGGRERRMFALTSLTCCGGPEGDGARETCGGLGGMERLADDAGVAEGVSGGVGPSRLG